MTGSHPHRKLFIIATILQLVWGLVPSASQVVISEIPVELYIAIRWTISGLIFLAYLLLSKKWRLPSARDFFRVSLLGIGGFGLASFAMLYGLKLGGVSNFALTGAASPLITSILAILFLKEKPHRLFFAALSICIAGLVFLVIGKHEISSLQIALSATGLILTGSIFEGMVFVFSKRYASKLTAFEYLAIGQLMTAAFMWILQFTTFHQIDRITDLSPRGISAALFVSIVACVLCFSVLYWLLKHLDGHRLALFDGLHSLSGTLFGVFIFHERMNSWIASGGILLLTGLVLGNLPSSKKTEVDALALEV